MWSASTLQDVKILMMLCIVLNSRTVTYRLEFILLMLVIMSGRIQLWTLKPETVALQFIWWTEEQTCCLSC